MYTKEQSTNSKSHSQQMYDRARSNLMVMLVFTVLNIFLYYAGSTSVMLFAAIIPYMAVTLSEYFITSVAIITLSFAAAVLLVYLLCWNFSKKHFAWMIVALVFFAVDTAALIYVYWGEDFASGIIDFLVHIWVLYYLVMGVYYGIKLRKEKKEPQELNLCISDGQEENVDTTRLYEADMSIKHRVLAECDAFGYYICYRRVKRTNELVINNYVYDSVEMLIEPPHSLNANLNGHHFQVGYNGVHSYIKVDGELITRKLRFW